MDGLFWWGGRLRNEQDEADAEGCERALAPAAACQVRATSKIRQFDFDDSAFEGEAATAGLRG
jgi:hypothetical protein